MIYWAHRVGVPLSRWLPVFFSYALSELFAPLIFLIWREKREHAVQNMMHVLGPGADPSQARRLARRSFVNYGKYLIDMMRLRRARLDEVNRRMLIEGWEHFLAAMEKGRGLVFVGGHIGNSDLAAAILALRGFPVNVIAEPLSPPRWNNLVQQARAAVGLRVIPMSSGLLQAMRVLRDRQILGFLIDRPMEDQGVMVEFFGRRTRVPGGPAALALRSGASVLGAYIVRSGNHYIAQISPEIPPPDTGDGDGDLEALTQHLFSWLEQVIRNHPDQWFMFRPMWPLERSDGQVQS